MVEEIRRRYQLGIVRHWDDLGGSQTRNLRLSCDRHEVVARIHRRSTGQPRLAAIQTARTATRDAGLPTPAPLPAVDGSTMITLDGGHLAEVEPYLHWTQRMNTAPLLHSGFTLLGRLHDALRTAPLPPAADDAPHANHLHAMETTARVADGVERIRSWGDPELITFADRARDHLERAISAEAPLMDDQIRQVVHGDFWDNNVLFADDQPVAIIDFDFMGRRARIDDLALTIYFWLLQPGRALPDARDREQVAEFVDAYDTGTTLPLSTAERMALPLAVARQPGWSLGRWIPSLDEPEARRHAADAMAEFAVAEQVLTDLERWQATIGR